MPNAKKDKSKKDKKPKPERKVEEIIQGKFLDTLVNPLKPKTHPLTTRLA